VRCGALRGVPVSAGPHWLPPKHPGAERHCRFDLDPVDAALASGLSLAVSPSGSGELAPSGLVCVSGGQTGRVCTLMLSVTRADGTVSESLLMQPVDPVLATDTAQEVPSVGFGTPLIWNVS